MMRPKLPAVRTLVLVGCLVLTRRAGAQAPAIEFTPAMESSQARVPGSQSSMLGPSPGFGAMVLGNMPGTGGILGGRPGTSTPRVPTSVTTPGMPGGPPAPRGIAAPAPLPIPTARLFGTLAIPAEAEREGPANGLTLDAAIERLIRENLELRTKSMEIPQAEADVLQANLRANPIFYADSQLIPYGQYTKQRPGGQLQYDVNVSYPLNVSHKRQARTRYYTEAQKVLVAQYQDAVRRSIDNLYTAYVNVLEARQTVLYARSSVAGLGDVLKTTQRLLEKEMANRADVNRAKVESTAARTGLLVAEEELRQRKRVLATLLNLTPEEGVRIEVRGAIQDRAPPPPALDELRRIALDSRPDVVSFRLGVRTAEENVRLQLANRFSDIYVLYQPYTFQNNAPTGLKSPTSWALGATVPLPVSNRNQGNVLKAKLNVTQSQIDLARAEQLAISEVDVAFHEYEMTRRAVQEIRDELLPSVNQMKDDTYKLYTTGEVNLIVYLNAQREYNDRVKQYLDTAVRHRRSMLALNTAVGQRILP